MFSRCARMSQWAWVSPARLVRFGRYCRSGPLRRRPPGIEQHFGLESDHPEDEIGREAEVYGSTDHRVPPRGRSGVAVKDLCRRQGFSDASYYRWRSKCGGMSVSDAKRLKALETENGRLKKLLVDSLLEIEVTREVLRKQW